MTACCMYVCAQLDVWRVRERERVCVCVYEIIPYDLLASSLVKSEALVHPICRLQPCPALPRLVVSKSGDPKINWLENNVTCIYWFMDEYRRGEAGKSRGLDRARENVSGHMWPCCVWGQAGLYRRRATQLATVCSHFPPTIEVTLATVATVATLATAFCIQFGFRSVHFNIYP